MWRNFLSVEAILKSVVVHSDKQDYADLENPSIRKCFRGSETLLRMEPSLAKVTGTRQQRLGRAGALHSHTQAGAENDSATSENS